MNTPKIIFSLTNNFLNTWFPRSYCVAGFFVDVNKNNNRFNQTEQHIKLKPLTTINAHPFLRRQ